MMAPFPPSPVPPCQARGSSSVLSTPHWLSFLFNSQLSLGEALLVRVILLACLSEHATSDIESTRWVFTSSNVTSFGLLGCFSKPSWVLGSGDLILSALCINKSLYVCF